MTSTTPTLPGLRRASAKFAGRQKVHVSNKFGFTKYTKKEVKCFLRWFMMVGLCPVQRLDWAFLKISVIRFR